MAQSLRARSESGARFGVTATCLLFALLAYAVFANQGTGDYLIGGAVSGDNAGPAIQALLHGSLAGYVSHEPLIGLTSLLLRLPLAALAPLLGGGNLLTYQLGALACVLPLALLGGWLVAAPGLSLRARLLRLLALLIVATSPVIKAALGAGHPEDILSAVLCTGAVIAATRGRPRLAAVLLGLAIGTKDWAVIAVVPVLIALPGKRRQVGLIAGAVALVLFGLPILADPAAFVRALHAAETRLVNQFSLLWPVSSPVHLPGGQLSPAREMPFGLHRSGASALAILAVAAFGVPWWVRARRRGAVYDPLALLVLLALLRCVCDSTQLEYYLGAVLIPLGTWEALQDRPPVVTFLLSVACWLLLGGVVQLPDAQMYILWTTVEVVLGVYLARRALGLRRNAHDSRLRPDRVTVTPMRQGAAAGGDLEHAGSRAGSDSPRLRRRPRSGPHTRIGASRSRSASQLRSVGGRRRGRSSTSG